MVQARAEEEQTGSRPPSKPNRYRSQEPTFSPQTPSPGLFLNLCFGILNTTGLAGIFPVDQSSVAIIRLLGIEMIVPGSFDLGCARGGCAEISVGRWEWDWVSGRHYVLHK